ncbi:MAG TPA: M48 family metallopeptidase [Verrucomicrobiae bacterium]|nr:M48 family metallopeptidase [Verrucomicrobiae bacterium]
MRTKAKSDFSKLGFIKSYLLPALVTFLIPGFGLWFFDHVESYYDQHIREAVLAQIRTEQKATEAQREKAIQFYSSVSVSKILASNKPEAKRLQANFDHVKTRYAIFRWMKRTALVCLITAAGAFVAVGLGVLFSFRSQTAQYWSLRVGWNVLRWFAVIQVLGQGALAVALSFWITAFWAERYYVKLIIVAALLAGCAVLALIAAIFRKLPAFNEFSGRLVTKEAAPALWGRVLQMAEKLRIAPPDNIFVGIDDNFFVTEHPVKVSEQQYRGRTLFASLSLLKTLSRSEADAVLAHELAHFSGEDTIYGRRISPLLGKYVHYLEALYAGGISRPIFHFMLFFWNLYQLSLNKLSRQREFRADKVGAELTSPQDIAQALVKIAAYCHYRGKIQKDLFGKEQNVETMDVFDRIEKGFPAFMNTCLAGNELAESDTPHPFDSHPPLGRRVENIGLDLQSVQSALKATALPAEADSWFSAIEGAAAYEAEQWKAFEDAFHKAHQESLAWRFKPEGESEIQHVMKYFPAIEFKTARGLTAIVDYEKVVMSDWDSPLLFSTVLKCRIDDTLGRQRLVIDYQIGGEPKRNRKIAFKDFPSAGDKFLETFKRYYARHLTAKEYLAQKIAPISA